LELLRELTRLQHELGYLDDSTLRELAARKNVPLYRLEGLVGFYPHFRRTPPPKVRLQVCRDVVCAMAGCGELTHKLREQLHYRDDIELQEVSCLGRCDSAPALAVHDARPAIPLKEGASHTRAGEQVADYDAPLAPMTLVEHGGIVGWVETPESVPTNRSTAEPLLWKCDPYKSPAERYGTVRSLVQSQADVAAVCIDELKAARLCGMGGAGFPTGVKWELVAREPAAPKYVICNADESEPGTFKDRMILAELPHLIVEGMLLAGLTIGAEQGIVYLRHEYEPEHQALQAELNRAYTAGILGENAAGSGRRFDIEVFISPGGYILGEETALLEALEDKRGEPRNKPPYPGTHGLWGQPTLINNVETFALAASIIHHGRQWWQDQGHGENAGLKFISVSGDVHRPGVYEIPYGLPAAELIELAGGMKDGQKLQAFLPGGASSNFLPADRVHTPLTFADMQQAGSMLGSGALIAIAEGRDLFALATNLVRFFRNESCGKCVPCRLGSQTAVELLEGVQAGSVERKELAVLTDLGDTLQQTSICGLGQVALNPILSMLQHFPAERE
jgi:formate dehydrogenase beta subunit